MYGNSNANAYKATQVSTSSKPKLILLMYDGAIRFINDALSKISNNDIAGRGISISRAQRIVNELESTLDSRKGGEVAENLRKNYMEINRSLIQANITGEIEHLNLCLEMLGTLKDALVEVIKTQGAEDPQSIVTRPTSQFVPNA